MTIYAGILGIGRWGQVLINSIHNKSEAIAVSAGCTGRKERAIDYCKEKGIDLRDDFTDLLTDNNLDAILISTPHDQHADQIVACAEAGKHVFVEKPFTLTKKSAERARDACNSAGIICALGHNRRFLPNMTRLREFIADGEIGDLIHAEANISARGRNYTPDHWRTNPSQCPAGSMTGLGVHMTDALISLMGPVAEVNAKSEIRTFGKIISPVTFMTLRFASGATGVLSTLFQSPPIWFIRVIGNKGWATINGYNCLVTRKIDDNEDNFEKFTDTDTELAELEAFAGAIQRLSTYAVSPDEAVHGTEVLEAIVTSVETGQPTKI